MSLPDPTFERDLAAIQAVDKLRTEIDRLRTELDELDTLNDKLRQDQGLVCADNAAKDARIRELEKALRPFANIDTDLLPRHWDAARLASNKSTIAGGVED